MKINKQTFLNIYFPILLFLISFCWKLYYIGTRDVCLDEPFTLYHAQFNVWNILKLPTQNEPNPPLFMLLLHFWIKLFGISASSIRFLPLFCNALTTVFMYFIGKKFFSLWSGILSSGIFILSTYHFYFGLEARTYSMLSMATAASLYFFISLIKEPNKTKYIPALIISNFFLIYSHYFGLLIVFVQLITSFMFLENKKIFKKIWIAIIITGILFLPMAIIVIKQFLISSKGTWVQPPSKSEYLNQIWWFLNSKIIFNITLFIFFIGIIYAILTCTAKKIPREFIIIFLWWFIPFTLMFFVSFKIPMFLNRYILFNTIGFYLSIAIIINMLYDRTPLYIVSGLYLYFMFTQLQINSKDFYYREVKNTVNDVKNKLTPNTIILIYPSWADLGFMYYYNRSIFQNVSLYDTLLNKNNIYHVWNFAEVKEKLKMHKNNRIIFIQDGQLEDKTISTYLDSIYVISSKTFYPQCFNVSSYEMK